MVDFTLNRIEAFDMQFSEFMIEYLGTTAITEKLCRKYSECSSSDFSNEFSEDDSELNTQFTDVAEKILTMRYVIKHVA